VFCVLEWEVRFVVGVFGFCCEVGSGEQLGGPAQLENAADPNQFRPAQNQAQGSPALASTRQKKKSKWKKGKVR